MKSYRNRPPLSPSPASHAAPSTGSCWARCSHPPSSVARPRSPFQAAKARWLFDRVYNILQCFTWFLIGFPLVLPRFPKFFNGFRWFLMTFERFFMGFHRFWMAFGPSLGRKRMEIMRLQPHQRAHLVRLVAPRHLDRHRLPEVLPHQRLQLLDRPETPLFWPFSMVFRCFFVGFEAIRRRNRPISRPPTCSFCCCCSVLFCKERISGETWCSKYSIQRPARPKSAFRGLIGPG